MLITDRSEFPQPGWWRHLHDVGALFAFLTEQADRQYPYESITFSHDVLIGNLRIGEAGSVEIIGGIRAGMMIGFFARGDVVATYQSLDPRATLALKGQ